MGHTLTKRGADALAGEEVIFFWAMQSQASPISTLRILPTSFRRFCGKEYVLQHGEKKEKQGEPFFRFSPFFIDVHDSILRRRRVATCLLYVQSGVFHCSCSTQNAMRLPPPHNQSVVQYYIFACCMSRSNEGGHRIIYSADSIIHIRDSTGFTSSHAKAEPCNQMRRNSGETQVLVLFHI
jgi:hypothetical protein